MKEDKRRLIEFYDTRFDCLGYSVEAAGWGSRESQELRICDLGCGFGDLYPYLWKRFRKVDYLGIDLSEKLVAEARRRHPDAEFLVLDILESGVERNFDYVLSSGALTFKMRNHRAYVERVLRRMYEMAGNAVAVNFLDTDVDYELEKNFHFPRQEALALAESIAGSVKLRSDYPLREFTLYMYHEQ